MFTQIKTGEGKTTIVAILASINALRGKYVDVLTSSEILAERDSKENNLTVGQIILTPLKQTIDYLEDGCNLVFHGDDDRWADSDEINMLCAMKHIETFTIPDANHSLEVGDIGEDIDNLNEIISLIENYISDYE